MSVKDNPKIQRWQREHVLRLAEHFHEYDTVNNQHRRVSKYKLNADDLKTIQGIWSDIKEMGIHLGLRKEAPEENNITFVPIFVVKTTEEFYFEMEIAVEIIENDINAKGRQQESSGFVPKPYVDMVTENWRTIDFNLIDDLFVVQLNKAPLRVMSYHITDTIIEQLTQLKGDDLLELNLYLGVDMNKFSTTSLPSFTPVYGYKFEDAALIDKVDFFQALTCSSRTNDSKAEEIFVQYARPCPPTC